MLTCHRVAGIDRIINYDALLMFRNVTYLIIQDVALWGLKSGRALVAFDVIHLPYHYIYQIPFTIQLGDLEFRHRH